MLTTTETQRLLVTRQDPETRKYKTVGVLELREETYTFEYDTGATRPLPGLDLGRTHTSTSLFPVFAERVMSPMRPDQLTTLEQLDLGPDATPFEVLATSGGRRTGDTYELIPLPQPGPVSFKFLVHGVRYLTETEQARIDDLVPGMHLTLVPEPTNEYNDRAVLVTDAGERLGYVPDPLVEQVHRTLVHDCTVTLVRVNPPEAGYHMRLLVRLDGLMD